MTILSYSTQLALYDAARYLQENQEIKAKEAIDGARGKLTSGLAGEA